MSAAEELAEAAGDILTGAATALALSAERLVGTDRARAVLIAASAETDHNAHSTRALIHEAAALAAELSPADDPTPGPPAYLPDYRSGRR